MSKAEGVYFTMIATNSVGEEIAGRCSFFAEDYDEYLEHNEGELIDFAERVFDKVETHGCD